MLTIARALCMRPSIVHMSYCIDGEAADVEIMGAREVGHGGEKGSTTGLMKRSNWTIARVNINRTLVALWAPNFADEITSNHNSESHPIQIQPTAMEFMRARSLNRRALLS